MLRYFLAALCLCAMGGCANGHAVLDSNWNGLLEPLGFPDPPVVANSEHLPPPIWAKDENGEWVQIGFAKQ